MSIKRRTFLRTASVAAAALALSACGATPTATPVPPTATKPPAPTNTPVPLTAAPAAPTATKPPAVATAAATPVPPTATPVPAAKDTTSAKWLLPGSGGLPTPITKDKMTLTYWTSLMALSSAAGLTNFNENAVYIEMEKRTNIHMNFQHPAIGDDVNSFNLLAASRKFPDIIEWSWERLYPGGGAKAILDGVIIDLSKLIDQYAPNFKNTLDKNPEMRKQVVNDNGQIACFPCLKADDPSARVSFGLLCRGDFLDKLNIKPPTTVDEWHEMLVAFKTKDPNGNGKADEIPFNPAWGPNDRAYWAFYHGFVVGAYGIGMRFYHEGGKVKWGPIEPAFKDFLTTIAQWYKEGLIDPDWLNMSAKLRDAKHLSNTFCSMLGFPGNITTYTELMQGKEPASYKLIGLPYPTLKKGDRPLFGAYENIYPSSTQDPAISTACKNVKEAVQYLDYGYSYDGHMLFNYGIEGVTFNWVDGEPQFTDLILKNPEKSPSAALYRYTRKASQGPFVEDVRGADKSRPTYAATLEASALFGQPTHEKMMPPVSPTTDESKKYASVINNIQTLFDESFAKTFTGQTPVSDWDKTVAQFKQLGIADAIAVQQAALDRYNKR